MQRHPKHRCDHTTYFESILTIRIIKSIPKTKTKPPQKGIVTYHQDQSITLHNFSITNATPNKPSIPIPELELESFAIFYFYLL